MYHYIYKGNCTSLYLFILLNILSSSVPFSVCSMSYLDVQDTVDIPEHLGITATGNGVWCYNYLSQAGTEPPPTLPDLSPACSLSPLPSLLPPIIYAVTVVPKSDMCRAFNSITEGSTDTKRPTVKHHSHSLICLLSLLSLPLLY